MHQAMVDIIIDVIKGQFRSESQFCQLYLKVPEPAWEQWKAGKNNLNAEAMQKIKGLFSDYEWMLLQKTIQQTTMFPEKRNYVVQEYKRSKTMIALKWIKFKLCDIELITKPTMDGSKETINLRISMTYDEWGYDDVLNFIMPAVVSKKIEGSSKGLLEWVNTDLTETYVEHKGLD